LRQVLATAGLVSLAALAPRAAAEMPAESDPPAASGRERRLALDLGWDGAPTYRLGWRFLALDQLDPRPRAPEIVLDGRIGAKLFLDGGWLGGGAIDDGWEGAVRRARIFTHGTLQFLGPTRYKFEVALEKDRVFLNDFYFERRFERWIDSLRTGYFDPPISLENLGSSDGRELMEVAAPVGAFVPGYRMGISVARLHQRPSLSWSLNLSSVGQIQQIGDASEDVLRGTGRLVWRPIWNAEQPESSALLHLGASASFTFTGSGDLRYRARPESFLAPYLVDTGDFEGDAGTVAAEILLRRGPASLMLESLNTLVGGGEGGTLFLYGFYAQLGWVITGESRSYDPEGAVIGRVTPREPYAPFKGRWGAFQATGRISWLDLSDGPVRGGRMLCLAAGPTWTWNDHVRWNAEYVLAHTRDRPGDPLAHVFQARVELRF
jgi:phosphate-selective porin OprO/OprP